MKTMYAIFWLKYSTVYQNLPHSSINLTKYDYLKNLTAFTLIY